MNTLHCFFRVTRLIEELITSSAAGAHRAVTMYHKNYNAWSYKRWMCERIPADRYQTLL